MTVEKYGNKYTATKTPECYRVTRNGKYACAHIGYTGAARNGWWIGSDGVLGAWRCYDRFPSLRLALEKVADIIQ